VSSDPVREVALDMVHAFVMARHGELVHWVNHVCSDRSDACVRRGTLSLGLERL